MILPAPCCRCGVQMKPFTRRPDILGCPACDQPPKIGRQS